MSSKTDNLEMDNLEIDNLEIELKFSVQKSDLSVNALINCLNELQKQSPSKASQTVKKLSNTYFETENNFLRQHDMGLRIRGVDDRFEMTLKTAAIGSAGVQQRHEYNVELARNELDIEKFPESAFPAEWDLRGLNLALKPLFTTDFYRKTWHLVYIDKQDRKSEIEVVFDDGMIFANGRSEPIHELEMELKQGHPESMLEFAESFLSIETVNHSLRLSDLSKAARGYMLFNQTPLKAPKNRELNSHTKQLDWLFYLEESILRDELPTALPDTNTIQHSLDENIDVNSPALESYNLKDLEQTTVFSLINYISQSLAADFNRSVERNNINKLSDNKQSENIALRVDRLRTKQDIYLSEYNLLKLKSIDIHG